MLGGKVCAETQVNVAASKAWELYGTLELGNVVSKHLLQSLQLIHGDGGVGTILELNFKPGSGFSYYKEKFTKVDNQNMIKETEIVQGGFLDIGFTLYRVRFEIIDSSNSPPDSCCIIRSTIEYQLKEEAAANASLVTIEPLVALMNVANNHLLSLSSD